MTICKSVAEFDLPSVNTFVVVLKKIRNNSNEVLDFCSWLQVYLHVFPVCDPFLFLLIYRFALHNFTEH